MVRKPIVDLERRVRENPRGEDVKRAKEEEGKLKRKKDKKRKAMAR